MFFMVKNLHSYQTYSSSPRLCPSAGVMNTSIPAYLKPGHEKAPGSFLAGGFS
jgi:hypothetical protein